MAFHSSLKGAFWAVLSALCFSILMTINKWASDIPVPLMVWGRCFFAACTIVPFLKVKTLNHYVSWQLLRGFFATCAMLCTYTAYQLLNLHEAAILGTAGPLFIILISTIFLKEKLSSKGWAIFSLGYIGIAVIMFSRYFDAQKTQQLLGAAHSSPWYYKLFMVGSGLFASSVVVMGRFLSSKKVSSQATLWYGTMIPLVAYSLYLPFNGGAFLSLTASQWMILTLLGVFGAGSAGFYLLALSHSSASFLAPFEYLRPVFLIPIGMIFWHKYPGPFDYIGGTLIILSSLWITHHEKKHASKKQEIN